MSVAKLGFKINFIKFQLFRKHFKNRLTPWFKKETFLFKKTLMSFLRISVKLNNCQIITETHKRLSI